MFLNFIIVHNNQFFFGVVSRTFWNFILILNIKTTNQGRLQIFLHNFWLRNKNWFYNLMNCRRIIKFLNIRIRLIIKRIFIIYSLFWSFFWWIITTYLLSFNNIFWSHHYWSTIFRTSKALIWWNIRLILNSFQLIINLLHLCFFIC